MVILFDDVRMHEREGDYSAERILYGGVIDCWSRIRPKEIGAKRSKDD